ncbi:MAG: STAS domain-containing protein [Ignavibacteriaceae bacterium]|jgi:anti-sigma B factor antagonist|nr:STAS domain-containing protein [Ignavibacteriaceae bacterium]
MFRIETENIGLNKKIILSGRIDGITSSDVEKAIDDLIAQGERTIIIDLSPVLYISSAGLRIFLAAQKELRKIDGSLIFLSPPDSVQKIFEISGFAGIFTIAPDETFLNIVLNGNKNLSKAEMIQLNGLQFEILSLNSPPASCFSIGSYDKQKNSSYSLQDVVPVPQTDFNFALGLAATGIEFDDYRNYFGESVVINNNLFIYPAIRGAKVDFILEEERVKSETIKFLNGFALKGSFNSITLMKEQEKLISLKEIIAALSLKVKSNLFGLVFLAVSGGVYGMNLKKVPVISEHSVPDIFENSLFHEWFDFPVEGRYSNHLLAGFGLVVKDKSLLPDNLKKHFPRNTSSHIHSLIMEKGYLSHKIEEFNKEMKRIFNELTSLKVQHLMSDSIFKSGFFAIIEVES